MKVKLPVLYKVVWKICVKTTCRLPNIKLQSRKKVDPSYLSQKISEISGVGNSLRE